MSWQESPYKSEKELQPVERVGRFIASAAERLRERGIPVDKECRIDMKAFRGVYTAESIEEDFRTVEKLQRRFYGETSQESTAQQKLKQRGEQLEVLKTAIFQKNLGTRFTAIRSSLYDDVKHGVDNILVDQKTGNVVCVFDEVGDTAGASYENKTGMVLDRNINKRGGIIKYGVFGKKEGETLKFKLGGTLHVPIFYLALSPEFISEGLKHFVPEWDRHSEMERKLWAYFLAAIKLQVRALELKSYRLRPEFNKRLGEFAEFLAKEDVGLE